MTNIKNLIWGITLIIIGLVLGGNILGIFDINIFFDGWWTLLIIIPSFIGLFSDHEKTGNAIALIIGILLLLSCRDIIDFNLVWQLVIPIVFVVIGISLIFKNAFNKKMSNKIKELNEGISSNEGYTATFSSQNLNFDNEVFDGTSLNAIFGGIKLDLRKAKIDKDIIINTCSVFGGIDIYTPDNINVKIKSNSIFGGVSNKKRSQSVDNSYTIYINASCMFGGVDVK